MAPNFNRLDAIISANGANFPYVSFTDEVVQLKKILASLVSSLDSSVTPMTNIERALIRNNVKRHYFPGYRVVLGEYFNQSKKLDRRGKLKGKVKK